MDFYQDTKKFQELCILYRRSVALSEVDNADKLRREILELINFNSERLCSYFKLKMHKKTTKLDKKRGIILPSMSVNKIVEKGIALQLKDLTTLNPYSVKEVDGFNILLDHSGSMWFDGSSSLDNILRIYAQNFLALVLTNYIFLVSKRKTKICLTCVGGTPVVTLCDEINLENIDTFLPNSAWGNRGEGWRLPKEYAPIKFREFRPDFFEKEYIIEAINESILMFNKIKIHNFTTFFFTDGGLHRLGETDADKEKYLNSVINLTQKMSRNTKFLFTFIKTQNEMIIPLLNRTGIKNFEILNTEQLNNCFETFTQTINSSR